MNITIDKEFQTLLAPLTAEEFKGLEQDILDKGCLDTLKVWQGILIDGHNRYTICMRHGVLFDVQELEFDDREAVIEWMIRHQLSRRNQTPEQISYYRGKLYEQLKKQHGGDRKSSAQNAHLNNSEKTAEAVAEQYNVNQATIRRDADYARAIDTIAVEAGEEVKQQILSGELPMTKKDVVELARMPVEERQEVIEQVTTGQVETVKEATRAHVANNSGNNEWYTPDEFIEAARHVMGRIDLDPASNAIANEHVKATTYYSIDDDGLTKEWSGKVWMNPPYEGKLIVQFIEKLNAEFVAGRVTEAVVLVNNATETKWFQALARHASAVCFPQSRIKFWYPGKTEAAPLQGQAFLYLGVNSRAFIAVFQSFGFCAEVCN